MQIAHNIHIPWFQFDSGKDLRLLYLLQMSRVFVDRLALFFLPVFLFEMGSGWSSQGTLQIPWWLPTYFHSFSEIQLGMLLVGLFFALFRFVTAIASPVVGWMMHMYGNRITTTIGYAFYGFGIVCLHASIQEALFIVLAAVALGLFTAINQIMELQILADNAHVSNIGKDIGLGRFLMQSASMVAPLLSGLLIVYAGYESTFLAGILLLVGLVILVQHLSGKKTSKPAASKDMIFLLKNSAFWQMILSSVGRYVNDVAILLWPIYLFILLGSVDRVGYLYAASFFLAMIAAMVGGSYIDSHKSSKPFFGTGFALAGLWITRMFVFNPLTIAFVDALDRVASNYHWVYFETTLLKIVKIKNPTTYLVTRMMVISFFGAITWFAVGIMFVVVATGWQSLFILAAVGVLLSLVLRDNMRYDQLDVPK